MTIEQLDTLKSMVNGLGFGDLNITVEQYIQLYDTINGELEKLEILEFENEVDISEV